MMNTLDLTVDQAFWEARFSPWTLRNELESFAERSSYEDSLGMAFAHDQGVGDCFSPKGSSAYEMPGLTDCFSFMSYEETLNWVISGLPLRPARGGPDLGQGPALDPRGLPRLLAGARRQRATASWTATPTAAPAARRSPPTTRWT